MRERAEHIERAALAAYHAAASDEVRAALRLEARDVEGALLSTGAALPASAIVVNRTLGLGSETPATKAAVDEILTAYRNAGVGRYFIQVNPRAHPSELPGWLAAAGLEPARGWQTFARGRDKPPPAKTDLEVREVGPEHGAAFGRIVCDAFDLGDSAADWLKHLPGRPNIRIFMTFEGDTPAGTGGVFIQDGLAWMDFGATAPAFRRRGGQRALLVRRVEAALEAGCTRMFTCTGEAVAGEPQHSYHNILRAGFREDYVRTNYAPAKG